MFSALRQICSETVQLPSEIDSANHERKADDMYKEQAWYENLSSFFREDGGTLFFWEEQGAFVSVCRVEAARGLCILHDLETKPSARRKGYARNLLLATIDHLKNRGIDKVCVHIRRTNKPSLALHTTVGFVKVKDTARLLDGTVSSAYITMEFKIK